MTTNTPPNTPTTADILHPVIEFTRRGADQQESFQTLKEQLTHCPVLSHFNEDWKTEVHTDASQLGLAAVFMQRDTTGKEHIVAYASRELSDTERHYHSNELECLAVVWSVDDKFRHYIFGREFTMVMDNAAMTWMFTNRHLKHKFARWIITLHEYTYHVRHRPCALNLLTDALSRHPIGECSPSRRGDSWILFAQEDVSKAKRDDPDLATMLSVLSKSSGTRTSFSATEFYIAACGPKVATKNTVIAIPAALRAEISRAVHDSPEGGHIGQRATFQKVQERVWWPKMHSQIPSYVASCEVFSGTRRIPGSQPGLLSPITPQAAVFNTIGIDHVGPLTTAAD